MIIEEALHSGGQDVVYWSLTEVVPEANVGSEKEELCDSLLVPELSGVVESGVAETVLLVDDGAQVHHVAVEDEVQAGLIVPRLLRYLKVKFWLPENLVQDGLIELLVSDGEVHPNGVVVVDVDSVVLQHHLQHGGTGRGAGEEESP